MTMRKFLAALLLLMAGSAWAAGKDVIVRNVWVSETVPGQTMASVNLTLTCVKSAGKLVAVDSPVAESGEMQRPWPSGGKIRMSKVRTVRLPRGTAVEFGDRTISLMLLGLKQPLKEGDHIPVNLTVMLTDGTKVVTEASAEVRQADLSYKQYSGEGAQQMQRHR